MFLEKLLALDWPALCVHSCEITHVSLRPWVRDRVCVCVCVLPGRVPGQRQEAEVGGLTLAFAEFHVDLYRGTSGRREVQEPLYPFFFHTVKF